MRDFFGTVTKAMILMGIGMLAFVLILAGMLMIMIKFGSW